MVPHRPSHTIGAGWADAFLRSVLLREEAASFGRQMGALKHRSGADCGTCFSDGADSSTGQKSAARNKNKGLHDCIGIGQSPTKCTQGLINAETVQVVLVRTLPVSRLTRS